MSEYVAPLRDMQFVLEEIAPLREIGRLPGFEEASLELAVEILAEANKFATAVLSPLNVQGDLEGAHLLMGGEVKTPRGWREAYGRFVEGGWTALSAAPEYGGHGLPRVVSALVDEMWKGANLAFALCPMLTRGAIEALSLSGSSDLRARYLPKLVSGEWAGTMVLTEPQAGSDLGWIRTRAVPQSDGTYRLFGQKIFVTYGEHDLTANIVHLVLARTPDAPEGVKGLSLFIVPKFLLDGEGGPGERNDVRCLSLEHKLGIRASPTAVLSLGETEGAKGFLVGELNRGLEYMFIMMNAARFSVGVEGVGVSQRAYQRALEYARERVQGIELGSKSRERVPIVRHPDVRRMLMLMKSRTEAMRALYSVVALSLDLARSHPDLSQRKKSQTFADLFVPVVKGWCTETGILNASLGVQVHGGTGYVEATGAAQHLRDARITSIYEGTTGVQAADLVGRKVAKDGGDAVRAVIVDMRRVEAALLDSKDGDPLLASRLGAGVSALERAVDFIVASYATDVRRASIGAVPFLELLGVVAGGWQMGRAALASRRRLAEKAREAEFFRAKLATVRFYVDHVLTSAPGLAVAVVEGAEGALRIEDDQL